MLRKKKLAEFPDAVTARGTKHLNELCNAKKQGYQSYILYLIQRENCDSFKIANDIVFIFYISKKSFISFY